MTKAYNWRAKIGVMAPTAGGLIPRTFDKYAPDGVMFDYTKMSFPGPTPEGLCYLSDQVSEKAKMFKNNDVVLFGCTSGSCIRGLGWDKELIRRIEENSGCPGLTTTTAVLEAFEALGVKKSVVMTPYPDDTNAIEKKFMEDNGLEVLSITGVGFNNKGEYGYADPLFLYRNAKKLDMNGAEVFFLSCMALDTLGLVQIMEDDFGIPVITSHQASLWACLRHAGIKDKIPGLGKLFMI